MQLGVLVDGYNRNFTAQSNEFAHLGGSAIALWGRSSLWLNENHTKTLPASSAIHPNGPDGSELEVPLDTHVISNIGFSLGLWQKQSSLLFAAVSGRTVVARNLAYNIPRAAINLNDGHLGGDSIHENLLINTCR